MTAIATNKWEFAWGTLGATGNGPYTIQCFVDWNTLPPVGPLKTAASALHDVTIRNGYELVTDAAKTYAKVNSPSNNQIIAPLVPFTVSTDHKITWNRFDNCGNYNISIRWRQATTWQTFTSKVTGPFNWVMPQSIGEQSVSESGWANVYQSGMPYGFFTADAWSDAPSPTNVAHGSVNFSIQP
jgi:hypothetical protein